MHIRHALGGNHGGLVLPGAAPTEGPAADGLLALLRSYAIRVLRDVPYCDEKMDFMLAVLSPGEREALIRELADMAESLGHPLDRDELPSPHDPDELAAEIGRLSGHADRTAVERGLERHLGRVLAGGDDDVGCDDGTGPVAPTTELAGRVLGFASTFGLSLEDCSVVLFYYALDLCEALATLFNRFAIHSKPRFAATCTGIAEADVVASLSPGGPLLKSGLLDRDEDGNLTDIGISPMLVDGLSGFIGSFSHERFCRPAGAPSFALEDFTVSPMDLRVARALVESDGGFSLLLYGPPGTGKTEFARSLAAACGREAWFLGEGKTGSIRDRQAALALSMASMDRDRQLLVVDEADSLLAAGQGLFMAPRAMSKSWINGFLEAPTTRAVWIVNWTGNIDESAMRRFAFAVRFEPFSLSERARVWRRSSGERGLSLEPDLVGRLAGDYAVNASGVSRALSLLDVVRARGPDADPEAVLRASLDSQVTLVRDAPPVCERRRCDAYDPAVLNTDTPVEELTAAVAAWSNRRASGASKVGAGAANSRIGLRMLFWGPPGTGKTELCRHLAAERELPLVVRRGSDFLDMYVGQTEKLIAAAFREAEREGSLLLIDEADGFLRDRSLAGHSWEVTQVNELLTRMEGYAGLLVCCTNFMDTLDPACLRRFQLKVRFAPPEADGLARLLRRVFPTILVPDGFRAAGLSGIATPGDVSAVAERLVLTGAEPDLDRVVAELERECAFRRPPRAIGFRGD